MKRSQTKAKTQKKKVSFKINRGYQKLIRRKGRGERKANNRAQDNN